MSNSTSSSWYSTFFTELPNEFWRRAVPPEMTAAEVDFIEKSLDLAPKSRIVDAPCGSGRHSLALAARGHRVTGVDLSAEAIGYARKAGPDVDFRLADMRELPADGSYDAAICMGNSLGYFDATGTADYFAALAATVRSGGGLVIDYGGAAESILPGFTGGEDTMATGDITVEVSREYDVANSLQLSHYRFSRGTETVSSTAVYNVLTCGHLCTLLRAAGFTDISLCSSPDGEPYTLASRRLILTARRS
ncbi:class I SAM-dependent methyltransferase [Fodinicola feengrottensis]|uniref:Class I SAM-dependent methyltransferase n=1 Tax=Fodinicola feengrottensis TaxID=435914 RepID=A0ABN2GF06_9ACTN